MSLLDHPKILRPMKYLWAYDAYTLQEKSHWIHNEIPMFSDIQDWKTKITPREKNLVTQILRFFVLGDIEVGNAYIDLYLKVFKPVEVRLMMTSFANIESTHVLAYAHLIDSLGLPEIEYSMFSEYKEMTDKTDFFSEFSVENPNSIALSIAAFSGFTEGLMLFSSFAILLNFQRFNLLKGLGQIISYSIRDENLHCLSMIKLFNVFVDEQKLDRNSLSLSINSICRKVVDLEDRFIELAFEKGNVEGLTKEIVMEYIRHMADKRLVQLGFKPIFGFPTDPLPWVLQATNCIEHSNFFETKSTEYSKGNSSGSWSDVFG